MSHTTSHIPAILLLEDGSVHHGQAFGKKGTTSGEICFNTGMTGYQEVFTDPSYYGQVLIMNSVHIGNYGVKDSDIESGSVKIRGLIARNLEEQFSRIQAKGSLDEYLKKWNVCGIQGVDTRALTKHLRVRGAMRACISTTASRIDNSAIASTWAQIEIRSKCSRCVAYKRPRPGRPRRASAGTTVSKLTWPTSQAATPTASK